MIILIYDRTKMEETNMTDIRNSQNWSFETKQVHIGQELAGSGDRGKSGSHLCIGIILCLMTVSMHRIFSP